MFSALLLAIPLLLGLVTWVGGPTLTVRTGWLFTLLVPTWMMRNIGGLEFDLRLLTAMVLIPLALFSGRLLRKPSWIDVCVVCFVAIGLFSVYRNQLVSPTTIAAVFSVWMVPYVMGRILVTSMNDLRALVPWACCACIFLSAWSIFESTTGINPLNVLAQRSGSFNAEHDGRMGLRRAEGPLGHPIFFGMVLALLFPWALEGASMARRRLASPVFYVTPLLCALGVIGTVSRGPMLVLVVSGVTALFFYLPFIRVPLFLGVAVSAVMALAAWPAIVENLETISGEKASLIITIEGKEYAYTGTRHRELLYKVYADAMTEAGVLGHGSWGAKSIHQAYIEPQLRGLFRSVDNHYILTVLNWGFLGLAAFALIGVSAAIGGSFLALEVDPEFRLLVGALSGSIVATLLLLSTVWFSPDYGFLWLLTVGVISSARSAWFRERPQTKLRPAHGPAVWNPENVAFPMATSAQFE
ncbi:O-Antigen ligase [Rubripirellula tenax]|uniref:O-Antigen ligase n=1 Tax=Rubripirellula tenax TaxID=2528015 RepID=A0A5C6FBB7_9BACT|nr:O-antigen ligase family protein [Rubripirellula tenax]TWU56879.1 O-Antigen ligase [Rubripirellula tenax]